MNITSTTGARGTQVFRLNDLFDVDFTGAGSQPEGFDELMAIYDRFRVYKSRLRLVGGSYGSTLPTASFRVVCLPSTSSATYVTLDDAASAPFAVSSLNFGGNPGCRHTREYTTATVTGVTPATVLDDVDYSGTVGAGPAVNAYWHVYVQAADLTSTVVATFDIELEYYVDFYARNDFALSVSAPDSQGRVEQVMIRKNGSRHFPQVQPGPKVHTIERGPRVALTPRNEGTDVDKSASGYPATHSRI
jgi:hypothetical protein